MNAIDSAFVGREEQRLFLFHFLHKGDFFGAIKASGLEVLVDLDLFFQVSGLEKVEDVFDFLYKKEGLHDHLRRNVNFGALSQSFQRIIQHQVGLFGKIVYLWFFSIFL